MCTPQFAGRKAVASRANAARLTKHRGRDGRIAIVYRVMSMAGSKFVWTQIAGRIGPIFRSNGCTAFLFGAIFARCAMNKFILAGHATLPLGRVSEKRLQVALLCAELNGSCGNSFLTSLSIRGRDDFRKPHRGELRGSGKIFSENPPSLSEMFLPTKLHNSCQDHRNN